MPVRVTFCRPSALGTMSLQLIGGVRATEVLSANSTTTAAVQPGEIVRLVNDEAATMRVAFGSTPDAAATAETAATSSGLGMAAGSELLLAPPVGSRINVKTAA